MQYSRPDLGLKAGLKTNFFLLGLVLVSDWTYWGFFAPDQSGLSQHCNDR